MKKSTFYKVILLVMVAICITSCDDLFSGNGDDNIVDTSLTIDDVLALIDANYAQDADGISQIKTALESGDVNKIVALYTPLMFAAQRNYADIIEALIRVKGIDVNLRNEGQDWTALMFASSVQPTGNLEAVKALLTAPGIDVNYQSEQGGLTALEIAEANNYQEVADALIAAGAV